mgnify:CR=1 FL=1
MIISGCPRVEREFGIIVTDQPANLVILNSVYDDYNSAIPFESHGKDIYFSTNRNSAGNHYDIVSNKLHFTYHFEENILDVDVPYYSSRTSWFDSLQAIAFDSLLLGINTEGNEYGPYLHTLNQDALFLYSSDFEGISRVKFLEMPQLEEFYHAQQLSGPFDISQINESGENQYPFINPGKPELYFCSNRQDTVFNIYLAQYNSEISKATLLGGDIESIGKVSEVSSLSDDKCPYIFGDTLVFASNKAGGYGGYDLWYSLLEENSWSTPINLGGEVNSEYDEFRPIVFQVVDHDLMIFSSNRPEGIGGFDLYIVEPGFDKHE